MDALRLPGCRSDRAIGQSLRTQRLEPHPCNGNAPRKNIVGQNLTRATGSVLPERGLPGKAARKIFPRAPAAVGRQPVLIAAGASDPTTTTMTSCI